MRHMIAIVFYTMLLSMNAGVKVQALRTPELFGDANAVMVYSGSELHGFIFNKDFGGIIAGTISGNEVTCRISQVSGETIKDVNGFVACYAIVKDEKWTGWIEFRGHHRKLCGARSIEKLPATCRLGSED